MKFWLKNANSGNTDSFSRPTTAVAADSRKKFIIERLQKFFGKTKANSSFWIVQASWMNVESATPRSGVLQIVKKKVQCKSFCVGKRERNVAERRVTLLLNYLHVFTKKISVVKKLRLHVLSSSRASSRASTASPTPSTKTFTYIHRRSRVRSAVKVLKRQ